MHADALATAIMAMGERKGLNFANENNLAVVLFVREDNNAFRALLSDEAQKLLENKWQFSPGKEQSAAFCRTGSK